MLSLPGPEEINQRKIMIYMTSGKYKKSSSQSINDCALMVANWTVVIATIMSMMKATQHKLENSPMMSRQPQTNSTDETKYVMTCGKGIPAPTIVSYISL